VGNQAARVAGERTSVKKKYLSFLVFIAMTLCCRAGLAETISNDDSRKAFRQDKFEKEGEALLKQGLYDEALQKFKQADDPSLRMKYFQDSYAKGMIRQAYYLMGEYEKSLEALGPLVKMNPTQANWQDEKSELEALIKARDAHTRDPVDLFLEQLKAKYEKWLPPIKYDINVTAGVTSDIIRCYDQIGDYDAGIEFVDGVLDFFKKEDIKKYGKLKWGRADEAYLQVRLAFEQDKKEGKTGCMGKPGCVGRATQILIQSNYFPW
jgi:tetratricopeptide (TPR) repeat protein